MRGLGSGASNRALAVAGDVLLLLAIGLALACVAVVGDVGMTHPSDLALIFFAILFPAWGFSVNARCTDDRIRRKLVNISELLTAWDILVLVKYFTMDDYLNSIYWYLYYVPMLLVSSITLLCALRVAVPVGRNTTITRAVALTGDAALMLLILTNNYHHQVFEFSFSNPQWESTYSYGWGYYLVFAWVIVQLGAFIVLVFVAARRRLRNLIAPVAAIGLLGVTYGVLYSLRVWGIHTSNFSLTFSILLVCALEACLNTGILPSYVHHRETFSKLPFDARILDSDFRTVISTEGFVPMPQPVKKAMRAAAPIREGGISMRSPERPGYRYDAYPLQGGTLVVVQDVRELDSRTRRLRLRQEQLSHTNEVLERMGRVDGLLWRQRAERQLCDEVEESLAETMAVVRRILDEIPMGEDAQSVVERRRSLLVVRMLVAYCKRKGALIFDEKADSDFDRERLELILGELSSDLRAVGVDCAVICEVEGIVPASVTATLYDCMYALALEAVRGQDAVLMLHVGPAPGGQVELNAMLDLGEDGSGWEASAGEDGGLGDGLEGLREELERHPVEYDLRVDGGQAHLLVRASMGVMS